MSFTEAIKTCFKKYATFTGRARRSEYWFWALFTAVIGGIAAAIEGSDSTALSGIVGLAFLIPNLAVGVRRMHDVGKSGWYLLMSLIPIVGWIFVLVKCCTDSVPGPNQYGEDPKGRGGYVPSSQPYEAPAGPEYSTQAQEAVFTEVKQEEPLTSTATVTGFCPYCGTATNVGQKFCTGCGAKLDV